MQNRSRLLSPKLQSVEIIAARWIRFFDPRYFGIMDRFDLKLIPEFDGSPTGLSVVEWFEKAKRICRLCKITGPTLVIPLRLTKGAYAVYQQLGDDTGLEEVKQALYAAFGADPFVTWRRFTERRLEPGETVDIYLADLRKLAAPFGGTNDRILGCTFLAGLPGDASRLLLAFSRLNELGLDELLARARNILKDDTESVSAAVEAPEPLTEGPKCYRCGGPNNFSRDCQSSTKDTPDQRAQHTLRQAKSHSTELSGKRARGEDAAPVSSPNRC